MTPIIILVVTALVALAAILGLAFRRPPEALSHDGGTLFAPLDVEAFRNLADPAEDAYLRQRLPAAEFRQVRRMRLHAMAAYVRTANRNAALLIEVGKRAVAAADPKTAAAARELVNEATRLRLNAGLTLVKIYAGLAWPFSPLAAFPIPDRYQRLSHAAMLLGRIEDPSTPVRISSGPAGP